VKKKDGNQLVLVWINKILIKAKKKNVTRGRKFLGNSFVDTAQHCRWHTFREKWQQEVPQMQIQKKEKKIHGRS
jgi:hypothetical protein